MTKQGNQERWRRFVEALARSWRTMVLTVRIPTFLLLTYTRYWFQLWPILTSASETAAERLEPHKSVYRHETVNIAYLTLKEAQLHARVKFAAIGIGLLTAGSGWAWLAVSAYDHGEWFTAVSAVLFLLNAIATAPAAAFTGNPWRRLGTLAVFWAALSVGLLAADGWPSLDLWHRRPPDTLQIFVFATGSVALFCLLGTLLARLAFFVGDVLIERRRTRRYPDTSALLYTLGLFHLLNRGNNLSNLFRRRELMWLLDLLAKSLQSHIPRVLTVRGHGLPQTARVRFDQAASTVRGYQEQVAMPGQGTGQELRARVAELVAPLVTGHYDLLPASEVTDEPPASLARRPIGLMVGGMVAVLPLVVVAVYPLLGFSLPDYLRQWLTGFAVVWLIAKVLQMLDPLYGNTWDRVHTVLNSKPPTDKT